MVKNDVLLKEFFHLNDKIKAIFDELGIESTDEDMLIIRREIYANGKSISRVNGTIIT